MLRFKESKVNIDGEIISLVYLDEKSNKHLYVYSKTDADKFIKAVKDFSRWVAVDPEVLDRVEKLKNSLNLFNRRG